MGGWGAWSIDASTKHGNVRGGGRDGTLDLGGGNPTFSPLYEPPLPPIIIRELENPLANGVSLHNYKYIILKVINTTQGH